VNAHELLKNHGAQMLRFCVVGAICYLTGMGALLLLCEVAGLHYVLGYLGAFLVTNAVGYLLNGRFTFAARSADSSMVRYMLVNVVMLTLNTVALTLLVELAHLWYVAATLLIAAVNIPISFFLHRTLSYRIAST